MVAMLAPLSFSSSCVGMKTWASRLGLALAKIVAALLLLLLTHARNAGVEDFPERRRMPQIA